MTGGVFIDLDAVARPDVRVGLGGNEYTLPGDIPVPTMLRFMDLQSEWGELEGKADAQDVSRLLGEMYDEVLALFQQRQPELERIDVSDRQIVSLLRQVMGLYEEPLEERPTKTQPRRNSRPSASAKKPKARRSSTS
jgi:hypothetical protein